MSRTSFARLAIMFMLCSIASLVVAADEDAAGESDDPLYAARLTANDAAAEAWKAAHPDGVVDEPSDDEVLAAANYGCPEGTQFWQRDRITAMCALLCTSDADCGPDDGRCRVLDVADLSRAPAVILVDDTAPEEVEAVLADDTKPTPPVMVCDPFFDVEGALDADLPADAVAE